jgi:hypothetical protein
MRAGPGRTSAPLAVSIVGTARIGAQEVVREAIPAEDRMQAFLWRHLVPASELQVMIFDPRYQAPAKRPGPARPAPAVAATTSGAVATNVAIEAASAGATLSPPPVAKPKFTKQQIAGRLRQLKLLYEEGLLSNHFYDEKVSECEEGR